MVPTEKEKNSLEAFLRNCKKNKTNSTINAYRSHLKKFFKAIGKSPLNYITVDMRRLDKANFFTFSVE
jgi:hypothetical protein